MAAKKKTTKRKPRAASKRKHDPSTDDRPSHGSDGRFLPGNQCSKGNPLVARIAQWRARLAKVVTDADVDAVIKQLVAQARNGAPWAIVEFLNRTIGKPMPYVDTEEDHDAIGAELLEHLRRAHESMGMKFEERN